MKNEENKYSLPLKENAGDESKEQKQAPATRWNAKRMASLNRSPFINQSMVYRIAWTNRTTRKRNKHSNLGDDYDNDAGGDMDG